MVGERRQGIGGEEGGKQSHSVQGRRGRWLGAHDFTSAPGQFSAKLTVEMHYFRQIDHEANNPEVP